MRQYLKLDYVKIKEQFPEAVKKIENWFEADDEIRERMQEMGADLESKDRRAFIEHLTAMIIQFDPRKLYDVFDDFALPISIAYNGGIWTFFTGEGDGYHADNRIDAELKAFMDAIEQLNNKS